MEKSDNTLNAAPTEQTNTLYLLGDDIAHTANTPPEPYDWSTAHQDERAAKKLRVLTHLAVQKIVMPSLMFIGSWQIVSGSSEMIIGNVGDAINTGDAEALLTGEDCPPAKEESRQEAQQILTAPDNPNLSQESFQGVIDKAAQAQSLTLFSPEVVLKKFNELEASESPQGPVTPYLELTNQYLAQFGVHMRPARTGEYIGKDQGVQVPDEYELNSATTKTNLRTFIRTFRTLPKEYVELVRLKEVVLVSGIDGKYAGMVSGGIEDQYYKERIFMNISFKFDTNVWQMESVLRHEMAHKLDAVLCEGWVAQDNDAAWMNFNTAGAYTISADATDKASKPFTLENTGLQLVPSEKQGSLTRMEACAEQEGLDKSFNHKIGFVSNYASTNIVEDKAETGQILGGIDWRKVLNPHTPRIQGKFTEIYARLYERHPQLARYFADIALRNYNDSWNPCSTSYQRIEAIGGK